ncbi:MAG: hypothetical protein CBB97_00410 [Candidatus Endolissoclinum sp. TMED37]|nr:MAG: hypothetical protein CBB97_00410 [Candidatus Endolissoclinum sp. TMED37]
MILRRVYILASAIGSVMYKSYNTKKITKEQESILAMLAGQKDLVEKHWTLLESSGLTEENKNYILSPSAELYITMITLVHLHLMSECQKFVWSKVVRYLNVSSTQHDVVKNFKKLKPKLYNHTLE